MTANATTSQLVGPHTLFAVEYVDPTGTEMSKCG